MLGYIFVFSTILRTLNNLTFVDKKIQILYNFYLLNDVE